MNCTSSAADSHCTASSQMSGIFNSNRNHLQAFVSVEVNVQGKNVVKFSGNQALS